MIAKNNGFIAKCLGWYMREQLPSITNEFDCTIIFVSVTGTKMSDLTKILIAYYKHHRNNTSSAT